MPRENLGKYCQNTDDTWLLISSFGIKIRPVGVIMMQYIELDGYPMILQNMFSSFQSRVASVLQKKLFQNFKMEEGRLRCRNSR